MSAEELEKMARKIQKYCKARHCVDGCTFAYYENGKKKPKCKLRKNDMDIYPEDWNI